MNELNWRRTGDNQYPEEGQKCFVYFEHTGFSISKFSYSEDNIGTEEKPMMIKTAVFSDKGGFLGDEDVLWIPLKEIHDALPDSYKNSPDFLRWDDPKKVIKFITLLKDHDQKEEHGRRGYHVPAGTRLAITDISKRYPDQYSTAVYLDEEGDLGQCFGIPKEICKDEDDFTRTFISEMEKEIPEILEETRKQASLVNEARQWIIK